jgi:Ca-activated chloride channel homolog
MNKGLQRPLLYAGKFIQQVLDGGCIPLSPGGCGKIARTRWAPRASSDSPRFCPPRGMVGVAVPLVRSAPAIACLAKVLPGITQYRRVGLITFGPNQCNVRLELKPTENSASRIMSIVDDLVPAGQTPLTAAVAEAAEVLDFREKPGVIVLLTDGDESCGGNPCNLGKRLHAEADQLTVHVIGIRVKGYTWMGEQSLLDTQCLAEQNGGLYIGVESEDDLAKALEKTLGCPMLSERASP